MRNAFAIIHLFNITMKESGLSMRSAAETVLDKLNNGIKFTCDSHQNYGGRTLTNRFNSNIYFNNERKLSSEKVVKDDVQDIKKPRGKMKNVPEINYVKYVLNYVICLTLDIIQGVPVRKMFYAKFNFLKYLLCWKRLSENLGPT